MQVRSANNFRGIDVSNWQRDIDFSQVKSSGIQIVYVKATEGVTFTDSKAKQNYTQAKANGLLVGFYHFFRAKDEANAKAQAQFFINSIKDLEPDCKYALDVETTEGLDKNTLSNLAKTFIDEVSRITNKPCIIYTYTNFIDTNLTDVLKNVPLWVANYGVNAPANNSIWQNWAGFQYSSSGNVAGIEGNVDMNEFTNDVLIARTSNNSGGNSSSSTNISVREIQFILNNRYGLNIAVDNIFGSETFKAVVIGLQTELNKQYGAKLVLDGIVGPKTLAALVSLRSGASGNITWLMQALLVCKGYSLEPYGVDGSFGIVTLNAVKKFQSNNGLAVDGIVGINTWNKLLNV